MYIWVFYVERVRARTCMWQTIPPVEAYDLTCAEHLYVQILFVSTHFVAGYNCARMAVLKSVWLAILTIHQPFVS